MKNVTHGKDSFKTTDDIAEALVVLDGAFRAADTIARVEIPVPGTLSQTLWIHVVVGDRVPLVSVGADERDTEAPLPVMVPPGFVRQSPIDVQSVVDEQSFPYGYDWL